MPSTFSFSSQSSESEGTPSDYSSGRRLGASGAAHRRGHHRLLDALDRASSVSLNGTPTAYCYDRADKLTASTDAAVGTPEYDDHGNTTG